VTRRPHERLPIVLLALIIVALGVSGTGPRDPFTWLLEVAPILIALPLLVATARRFPLTPMLYVLIAVHAGILMLAVTTRTPRCRSVSGCATRSASRATTTIASATSRRASCRRWSRARSSCDLSAASGQVALLRRDLRMSGRERALRAHRVVDCPRHGRGRNGLSRYAGRPWDTQWDMFLALVGALAAQLTLARVHDRQLETLATRS